MDNLCHSLAGIALAELACHAFERQSTDPLTRAGWRRWLIGLAVVANNLPDADLIYSTRSKLDYLVHHRGHTHTLTVAIPLALLTLLLPWLWTKARDIAWSRRQWLILTGSTVAGAALHLLMDSANNYGIHPFWPVDNRWYYGDTIYIVEPWAWMALFTIFAHRMRAAWTMICSVSILALAAAAARLTHLVSMPNIAVLALVSLIALFASRKLGSLWRPWPGIIWVIMLLGVFSWGRYEAGELIQQQLGASESAALNMDVSLTPFPSNPFCWTAISAVIGQQNYELKKARVTPWPNLSEILPCPVNADEGGLAAMAMPSDDSSPQIQWLGQLSMQRSELKQLAGRCQFQALMKFARMPFWNQQWMGDLRYDHGPRPGFAVLSRNEPEKIQCLDPLPAWEEPRADLLPL